ncbi:UDP-glucuronosyltransferase 2B15 isoform X1 [Fukomys damarensis]|uniref:UDP-glucuronosyltransferase 2B15 isoform X1 n=1 Tax=Fukomys damarensis TaxID=885580 RepID=UPI0008FF4D67|nr:UDP-glucuronosyltransferase 2B15 isoform X1 [Fukomys damarensis]
MSMAWISALLLLQLSCYFNSGSCGKVLVWPMEYSHWMSMKNIIEELIQRGHEVTVLRPSSFIFVDVNSSSGIKFETFPSSVSREQLEEFYSQLLTKLINIGSIDSCLFCFLNSDDFSKAFSDNVHFFCKEAVSNKKLMTKLHESRFDVLLADPIAPCGELLAELLKIPFVYSLRFSPGFQVEKHGGGLIVPPSYVPTMLLGLGGQMSFIERVKNMIGMLLFEGWFEIFNEKNWNQFYSETLGKRTTLYETMAKAEMWLIRSYWDLEFPRPSLPNFDFVGGLHCKPAKPLPKEMEDFVQSSGEHGVVVFSLGSMISSMTEERANAIASALAQIPQKVLWRFDGNKPDTLGPNTQLYKWLPQNDLLGHPKTRAFVTHGGANGVYEAIYHGIPMVGIPLFGEQYDNIANMVAKGAAVKVNFITITSTELLNALKTVLNSPFYKENAMWLSTIHHDQPMKPLDRAAFWIEFVMRHKGAKHLRPLAQNLTWYQYHSLDVIGFLLAGVVIITFLVIKCCLICSRNFVKMVKKQKRE